MGNYQFVINQTHLGQEVKNIINYFTNDSGVPDFQALVDEVRAAYNTAKDVFTNTWSFDSVTIYDLGDARPRVGVTYIPTAGAVSGTDVGITLPTQSALLVRWIGSLAIVPNRGRSYIPGMSKDSLVGTTGLWQSATEAAMQVWASDMISLDDGAGITFTMAITRLAADGTASVVNPVSSGLVILVPATQRKRRLGVGS